MQKEPSPRACSPPAVPRPLPPTGQVLCQSYFQGTRPVSTGHCPGGSRSELERNSFPHCMETGHKYTRGDGRCYYEPALGPPPKYCCVVPAHGDKDFRTERPHNQRERCAHQLPTSDSWSPCPGLEQGSSWVTDWQADLLSPAAQAAPTRCREVILGAK